MQFSSEFGQQYPVFDVHASETGDIRFSTGHHAMHEDCFEFLVIELPRQIDRLNGGPADVEPCYNHENLFFPVFQWNYVFPLLMSNDSYLSRILSIIR